MEVYMRIYDIIEKKRDNKELTKEEIDFFIKGYVDGSIPDYQASALLMAIFLNGMNDKELTYLTNAMAYSGDMVDLSKINGFTVDKHSTGGVGDKTSLVICPIVASLGCKIAKMSGRGLGHTGGTIDKLESIPGFKVELPENEFFNQVNNINISIISQSGNITPADKKLYALRDTTATVDSIPLIASSIMSKKIAAGDKCILLDVKTGSGAFMKTIKDSTTLATKMVNIGKALNRNIMAIITDMDEPLGKNIGNSIEVIEAIETLKGNGPKDFTDLCIELATNMLVLATSTSYKECKKQVSEVIKNGKAYNIIEVKSTKSGYITKMNTENIGKVSSMLGAGRIKKEDNIDYSAGIVVKAKINDYVKKNDVIALLYTNKNNINDATKLYQESITIGQLKTKPRKLIYKTIK